MNGSSILVSAILGGIGGGLTALLIELVPGLRGRRKLRGVAGAFGAILAVTVLGPMARPALARYSGSATEPRMSASESAELEAALRARGIKDSAEAQAFGTRMAAAGLPLLDDERLIRRRLLLTRMLSPDDDRACAALIRGDTSALTAGIGRLTTEEREAWAELAKEAAFRAIRKAPAPTRPSETGLEAMVRAYVAGSAPEDQQRFGTVATHLESASDAEICWFGRFLGARAAQGRREAVASIERVLVMQ